MGGGQGSGDVAEQTHCCDPHPWSLILNCPCLETQFLMVALQPLTFSIWRENFLFKRKQPVKHDNTDSLT